MTRPEQVGSALTWALDAGRGGMTTASQAASDAHVPWRIAEAFNFFDWNRSGFLDGGELKEALRHYGVSVASDAAKRLLMQYDDTPDEKLDMHGEYFRIRTRAPCCSLSDECVFESLFSQSSSRS